MYRLLVFAGLILPLSAHGASIMQGAQDADGRCFRRTADCVENCGPIKGKTDDGCIDNCLRVDFCEIESHRSSRSNLPESALPESSMPDSRLPGDKLPDSRLP